MTTLSQYGNLDNLHQIKAEILEGASYNGIVYGKKSGKNYTSMRVYINGNLRIIKEVENADAGAVKKEIEQFLGHPEAKKVSPAPTTTTTAPDFEDVIEQLITEKDFLVPSPEKFKKFIAENDLKKKTFEAVFNGKNFGVAAYYINNELKKVELVRDGVRIYRGCVWHIDFSAFVTQIQNQLKIAL